MKAMTQKRSSKNTRALPHVCWVLGLAGMFLNACSNESSDDPAGESSNEGEMTARPSGWNDSTHGKVTPAYDTVFDADVVHTIRITISANDHAAMQANLDEITKDIGPDIGDPPEGIEERIMACEGLEAGAKCVALDTEGTCIALGPMLACFAEGDELPGDPGGTGDPGGATSLTTQDPMYVSAQVEFDGNIWTHVGMRYKGNSSLMAAANSNNGKIPFRLHFDKYEEEFPEIEDQRFYGFKKLTFSSNYTDDSQVRELFATELFRDRGVPAARAAFYRVMVDVGEGEEYWGLYTMVEDPSDNAMLDSQFGGHEGNIYKPEGEGADWTQFSTKGFVKKTNEDKKDYSDVQQAVAALLASQEDAKKWRSDLESVFDVDGFLRWLSVNSAMVNWDSYGALAHNYYVYADPLDGGRLRWIPWDHNMSMTEGGIGPGGMNPGGMEPDEMVPGGIGPGGTDADDVLHTSVGERWPLIHRILQDEVYAARYRELLEEALGELFEVEAASKRLRELHELIAPHVVGTDGERPTHTTISSAEAFEQSIDGEGQLIDHIATRHELVRSILAQDESRAALTK